MKENRLASRSECGPGKLRSRAYIVDLLTDVVLVTAGMLGAVLLVGVEFSPEIVHRSARTASAASVVASVAREKSQEIH